MKPGHDLFTQQLQRAGHRLRRDQSPEIELRQDPVQTKLLMQLLQPIGNAFRPADDDFVAPDLLIGDSLDRLRLCRAATIG